MPRRCALGCTPTRGVLHVFPNPNKFPEQFKAWVTIVSGKTECDFDHTKMRICDRHFVEGDRNRNNRLNALAVPSLFLRGNAVDDVQKSCESIDTTYNQDSEQCQQPKIDLPTSAIAVYEQTPCGSAGTKSGQALEQSRIANIDLPTSDIAVYDQIPCGSVDIKSGRALEQSQVSKFDLSASDIIDVQVMDKNSSKCFKSEDFLQTRHKSDVQLSASSSKMLSSAVSNKVRIYQKSIKNLRRHIYRLKKSGKSIKSRLENAEKLFNKSDFQKIVKNMSTAAKIFTNMQYYQAGKKPKGRRFKTEEKVLSLSLYKRSPKCYALMSKYFMLPSAKCLKRLLSEIKISPGINKIIFERLKKSVTDLEREDRLCTLIFDEMSIDPQIHYDSSKDILKGFASHQSNYIANHALVFMVKGVKKHYKQPVAYYFTNSLKKLDLKNIIKEVITHVHETGLIILCTVCDQSTVNTSTINDLVTETKGIYFRKGKEVKYDFFEVNQRKIIPIYDVPHLLKGLRNNLLTKTLSYVDYDDENKVKEVKWEYLEKLYAADKSFGELRCLQKLTEEHIVPDKIKKMRVKNAAQVFSHSVAVATEHLTARGKLPLECRNLIPITLLIDNLFDSLNCSSFQIPNGKQYKGAVKRNSPHHDLWKKAIKYLKTVKYVQIKKNGNKIRKVETTVPSVKNFIKTIEGIQQLWKILSEKYSFDSMLTRNLNQDPVENFFGNIRNCGARNTAPNIVSFEGAFKTLLLNNLNAPHSAQANCEDDVNCFLQSLEFFVKEKNIAPETNVSGEHVEIPLRDEILCNENLDCDLGQRNYVCGWVLRKCLKNIIKNCKACRKTVLCTENTQRNAYTRAKEYKIDKKWLCYSSKQLDECFYEIQKICVAYLKQDVPKVGLKRTMKYFIEIFVQFPFNCKTHNEVLKQYFLDVTLNVLIYSWCRSINRILSGKLTYNGDDEVKVAAQIYYNKHKHIKIKK